MGARLTRRLRLFALWAILLPFVASSLVASGFMPVRTDAGGILVVICTSDGIMQMAFDPVTNEPVGDSERDDRQNSPRSDCAWAASQTTLGLPAVNTPLLPALLASGAHRHCPDMILTVARATGLPPSTGPPSIV